MPRWAQMSRSAKTEPSAVRPNSTGWPSKVFATMRPRDSAPPPSPTYQRPRRSSALRPCMLGSTGERGVHAPAAAQGGPGAFSGEVDTGSPQKMRPLKNSGERGLGLRHDRLERHRLTDREIGQHLAVDENAGPRQAVDKAAVGESKGPHRGVQALNPKRAERALAALAIAKRILVRLLHRLLGDADRVLAPAVIALGGFEHLLVLGMGGDTALDACHG